MLLPTFVKVTAHNRQPWNVHYTYHKLLNQLYQINTWQDQSSNMIMLISDLVSKVNAMVLLKKIKDFIHNAKLKQS